MKRIAAGALCLLLLTSSFGACSLGNFGTSKSDDSSTESAGSSQNGEAVSSVIITNGQGEVSPYAEKMQNWLSARAKNGEVDVATYAVGVNNQAAPITLAWEFTSRYAAEKVVLEYGVKSATEKTRVELSGEVCSYELYNLYKATTYTWTVTGSFAKGEDCTASGEFTTTDVGPRVMKIDGIYNVRDAGGWQTASGKRVKQGLLYRGGALEAGDGYSQPSLKKDGKKYMSEVLQIKTELDLRGAEADKASRITNATLRGIAVSGYADAFSTHKDGYKEVFSFMAKKENYPMYVHCTGGADRTGTTIFLLNALLGVSENDLIVDYETTSFSIYGARSTKSGTYAPMFREFLTKLKAFDGETLSEKTEKYMLSIGVTQTEIDNIRAIFLGN